MLLIDSRQQIDSWQICHKSRSDV